MLAGRVTLTTLNTAYNLYTLMNANNVAVPRNCQSVSILSDAGNGTAKVFLGGPNISTTVYGNVVATSGAASYSSTFNALQLDGLFALTDTSGSIVNIMVNVI
jgi:hypothetical protein